MILLFWIPTNLRNCGCPLPDSITLTVRSSSIFANLFRIQVYTQDPEENKLFVVQGEVLFKA